MKVSSVEGVATHDGLESCGGIREDDGEALTEARTGRVWSREIHAVLRKPRDHGAGVRVSFFLTVGDH